MKLLKYETGSQLHGGATTGAKELVLDGIAINEPEDVIEHLEKIMYPSLKKQIATFNSGQRTKEILNT
jgi:hypothetical protein